MKGTLLVVGLLIQSVVGFAQTEGLPLEQITRTSYATSKNQHEWITRAYRTMHTYSRKWESEKPKSSELKEFFRAGIELVIVYKKAETFEYLHPLIQKELKTYNEVLDTFPQAEKEVAIESYQFFLVTLNKGNDPI